jgi:hypothetical protein
MPTYLLTYLPTYLPTYCTRPSHRVPTLQFSFLAPPPHTPLYPNPTQTQLPRTPLHTNTTTPQPHQARHPAQSTTCYPPPSHLSHLISSSSTPTATSTQGQRSHPPHSRALTRPHAHIPLLTRLHRRRRRLRPLRQQCLRVRRYHLPRRHQRLLLHLRRGSRVRGGPVQ